LERCVPVLVLETRWRAHCFTINGLNILHASAFVCDELTGPFIVGHCQDVFQCLFSQIIDGTYCTPAVCDVWAGLYDLALERCVPVVVLDTRWRSLFLIIVCVT
jgi:hypothetical protein